MIYIFLNQLYSFLNFTNKYLIKGVDHNTHFVLLKEKFKIQNKAICMNTIIPFTFTTGQCTYMFL